MSLSSHKVLSFSLFFLLSFFSTASGWEKRDGTDIAGSLSHFDFEKKIAYFMEKKDSQPVAVPSANLNFASKRKLLFSSTFQQSYPDEGWWPQEKVRLFLLAIFCPVILMIMGFWIAGLVITGRFSPFKTLFGFFGSWLAGLVLMICYFVFYQKSGGATGMIWLGASVATMLVSIYVSAVYRCNVVKGFLVFALHLIFAAIMGLVLLFGVEKVAGTKRVEPFWDHLVFQQVGVLNKGEQSLLK